MSDISGATVTAVRLSPNPLETGAAYLVSVTIKEVTARLYTLSASGWSGTGPYTQTLAVDDSITPTGEYMIYGDHEMSLDARLAEYDGGLTADVSEAGRVTVTALGIKPTVDIPVRIAGGILPIVQSVTISESAWSGSGPWTATAVIPSSAQSATVGPVSGSDADSAEAVNGCGIHVTDVSGRIVTLRAMLAKPAADITVGVMAI